jgi:hypothetical protein
VLTEPPEPVPVEVDELVVDEVVEVEVVELVLVVVVTGETSVSPLPSNVNVCGLVVVHGPFCVWTVSTYVPEKLVP